MYICKRKGVKGNKMASARQSNIERRRARDGCRKNLSDHICELKTERHTMNNLDLLANNFEDERTGLRIPPADVRLKPRAIDPYRWKILPEKEETFVKVFAKNLSDHSVNTYRLLCREVGLTFEAVLANPQAKGLDSMTHVRYTLHSLGETLVS